MWNLYRIKVDGKEREEIPELMNIDEPADCFGDDLYDRMIEHGIIESLDGYWCEGDSREIVMIHTVDDTNPDFIWKFEEEN